MTLAQDKALAHVFCEPITEGLWDRVFADTLDEDNETDIIWELYEHLNNEELQKVIKNLKDEFQEVFDMGYLQGVNLMKGQSVI